MRNATLPAVAAVLILGMGLAGCSGTSAAKAAGQADPAASGASTTAAGSVRPQAGLFTVPLNQMGHVQVVKAASATWPRLLRLTGSVDYDQFATTPVISQVSGPVARVLAVTGEHVQQGQTLLEVSSPDVAAARSGYLKASDTVHLAQQTARRDEDLYEHQAIAQADLQQAESTLTQAQADLETARQQLRIWGVPIPESGSPASAVVALKAPIAGEVVERDVSPGQLLQGGSTQCFVISDMHKVWVLANVYQNDLAYVRVGDPVAIATGAYAQPFQGRIQFLSPSLDPTTRTLQARIETSNPGGELKKQMYVTATVQAGALRNIVVVPDAAILRDAQNIPFVFLQSNTAPNSFFHHTVAIGTSQNGFTQVTSGLAPGQAVVGQGSLFLQFASSFSN